MHKDFEAVTTVLILVIIAAILMGVLTFFQNQEDAAAAEKEAHYLSLVEQGYSVVVDGVEVSTIPGDIGEFNVTVMDADEIIICSSK